MYTCMCMYIIDTLLWSTQKILNPIAMQDFAWTSSYTHTHTHTHNILYVYGGLRVTTERERESKDGTGTGTGTGTGVRFSNKLNILAKDKCMCV